MRAFYGAGGSGRRQVRHRRDTGSGIFAPDDQGRGTPARSCITPVDKVGAAAITTIEALERDPVGRQVQKAWFDLEVVQCGYCPSGQLMSAAALLASNPNPNDADIDAAMSGNICRCGTYPRIRAAIKQAARAIAKAREEG